MVFSLWFIIIPFAAVLVFAGVFLFFNVFHVARYGVDSTATRALMLGYVVGYAAIVILSMSMLTGYDWSYVPSADDIFPFSIESSNLGL